MSKKEYKHLTIKGADVEINTNSLIKVNGQKILETISPDNIEGSSIKRNSKYVELNDEIIQTNHFLLMLQIAFNEHKRIIIRPDDFWLLICQGFSEHIKINSDEFKDVIVGQEERQTIQVRRDDFIIGEVNPWEELFPDFTKELHKKINTNLYSNLVLNFSTSTKKEINAFEISFMDSMSNYFDYEFLSMCGIPEIEVAGTIEDYNKMLIALKELKKYNFDWWVDSIESNIEKIISTLKGHDVGEFWNSIYKEDNESGGPYITGWIADFFPYLKTSITSENDIINYKEQSISECQILKTINIKNLNFRNLKIHNVQIRNPRLAMDAHYNLTLDNFPSGQSKVSFKWKYLDEEIDMNFISGFIGIAENEETKTLNTDINWIVGKSL